MHETTLLIFAAVAFVGIATPGPTVLLALTNGSRYGVRRAAYGFAGAMLSDFVLLDGVVMFGYALLGARAVRLLKRSGALWLERTCGAMLLALAGSLALYRRHAA
ncbi:hypothetical protein CFB89_26985 [Burkholderia sp. AU16741]|uniref:hypothetical protein n=1 Tax=unclassified Burkholderia TaxID=2613784 RepID=UPI000B7ACA01|nr:MULTISPECIES: hypothetical protein [unclassified Burkholderia]MDN7429871.1 hypothetical protein [Burkholderia sp. AU45388]OXI30766.1 hypothetical protein CFB89_26985 [Burkholderia sp. AU16741]